MNASSAGPRRGEEVREQLRQLLTHAGSTGRVIRTHGDFHLGQTLATDTDWVILDFEGEPARTAAERRRKRSWMSSAMSPGCSKLVRVCREQRLAVARTAQVPDGLGGGEPERARWRFLDSYLATVDPALLPAGDAAIERLLAVFELEKAVYELRYELDNRPDWVGIPVAGIERLMQRTAEAI